MSEILSTLWVEKYRPKKLDDLVLPSEVKKEFVSMIKKEDIPNLLFHGPAGGGKTTLARVLCSPYGVLSNPKYNLLSVNGSSRSTRGIGFVDSVIEPFLKHPPVSDRFKVVFIDEADKLTSDGFDSLRAIIEKYQVKYGRFIFTCNYLSRIPEPIQSRFTLYSFTKIPKDYVLEYCIKILNSENVTFEEKKVQFIIDNLYPDVRKIVNTLQRNSSNGHLEVDYEDIITIEKKVTSLVIQIVSVIEKKQDNKIGQIVSSLVDIFSKQEIEYRNVYTDLFFSDKLPAPAKVIVNQYTNSHQNALVPKMHFMSMVFEIIKSLKDYRKLVIGE